MVQDFVAEMLNVVMVFDFLFMIPVVKVNSTSVGTKVGVKKNIRTSTDVEEESHEDRTFCHRHFISHALTWFVILQVVFEHPRESAQLTFSLDVPNRT